MKQLILTLAMILGFSVGNIAAIKGNKMAQISYKKFLTEVQQTQNLNKQSIKSDFNSAAKTLSLDLDPNLNLHK